VLLAVRAGAESAGQGDAAAASSGAHDDAALAAWEAQGVLLLWLSILVLTPFDLRTVDSSVGAAAPAGGVTPLAARIVELCQGYLDHPGAPGAPRQHGQWGRA
jgi:hypothetical protein